MVQIFDFGALVKINSFTEGLVHISELAPFRVGRVTDVVDVGDRVPVKVIGIDELGRVNFSIKAVKELKAKERPVGWTPPPDEPRRMGGGPRGGGGRNFRR